MHMKLWKPLLHRIDYLPTKEQNKIKIAFEFAHDAHKGQKRLNGDDFFTHPVAVASLLATSKMDHYSVIAGLLHDVVEDTDISQEIIQKKFGRYIALLVGDLTKLTQVNTNNRAETHAENFRKMLLAMSNDVRVIIIKVADRLHNMQTIGSLSPTKQKKKSFETLEIFAPIAVRLGMREWAIELEELSFKTIYPWRYQAITNHLKRHRSGQESVLEKARKKIMTALKQNNLKPIAEKARQKNPYSIYRKMRNRQVSIDEIMDVYAIRIITENISECYQSLGIIHITYPPMGQNFKDYIAIPKANGYQSLHTIIAGPDGIPIEVQIRTHEMDDQANKGVAAHWSYKNGQRIVIQSEIKRQQWLERIRNTENDGEDDPIDFVKNIKDDLLINEIYVFNHNGEIIELPNGATVLDFAYSLHSDIGNHCMSAKINKKFSPLTTKLKNGHTVEIITAKNVSARPGWLNHVVSNKAKSSIRHHLQSQRIEDIQEIGEKILNQKLAQRGTSISRLGIKKVKNYLDEITLNDINDLYAEIGLGNRSAQVAVDIMLQSNKKKAPQKKRKPLAIKGTEGLAVHYANCCLPIPHDQIVGIIEPGKGLIIHRHICSKIDTGSFSDEIISLEWNKQIKTKFKSQIAMEIDNRPGILGKIATVIGFSDSNIEKVQIMTDSSTVTIDIIVKDRANLSKILKGLRKIKGIHKIKRHI